MITQEDFWILVDLAWHDPYIIILLVMFILHVSLLQQKCNTGHTSTAINLSKHFVLKFRPMIKETFL